MYAAMIAAARWGFWSFVLFVGGKRHPSYTYALWSQWWNGEILRRWLKGTL